MRRKNDLTIFAWDGPGLISLFAPSPAEFSMSTSFEGFSDYWLDFSITNKGLLISGDVILRLIPGRARDGAESVQYVLSLGRGGPTGSDKPRRGGICLRKLGPKLFCKNPLFPLTGFGLDEANSRTSIHSVTDFYIYTDPTAADIMAASSRFRQNALHIPVHSVFVLNDSVPAELWDGSDRIFLRPKPYYWARYPMVVAMEFSGEILGQSIKIIVLCRYDKEDYQPSCKIFCKGDFSREEAKLVR